MCIYTYTYIYMRLMVIAMGSTGISSGNYRDWQRYHGIYCPCEAPKSGSRSNGCHATQVLTIYNVEIASCSLPSGNLRKLRKMKGQIAFIDESYLWLITMEILDSFVKLPEGNTSVHWRLKPWPFCLQLLFLCFTRWFSGDNREDGRQNKKK